MIEFKQCLTLDYLRYLKQSIDFVRVKDLYFYQECNLFQASYSSQAAQDLSDPHEVKHKGLSSLLIDSLSAIEPILISA